jgi:hypothetical protein
MHRPVANQPTYWNLISIHSTKILPAIGPASGIESAGAKKNMMMRVTAATGNCGKGTGITHVCPVLPDRQVANRLELVAVAFESYAHQLAPGSDTRLRKQLLQRGFHRRFRNP